MFIVKNRKVFYTLSSVLVVASIAAIAWWGLVMGIDFKGGSIMQFSYAPARPELSLVKVNLDNLNFTPALNAYELRPVGTDGYVLKTRSLSEPERISVQSAIGVTGYTSEIKSFNSVGSILGAEAAQKSIISVILVLLAIIAFITFAFRKVSEPVQSWKYGLFAIVGLFHNIIIPTGVFALLGHFYGYEVDTLFVTAILVILGFSVHDTIVVFDRVRENLKLSHAVKNGPSFAEVVGQSISQTMVRSINTSLTVLLSVAALYFFGPAATKNFSLVLFIGIFFGTYSSIFIASNLLVTANPEKK
jgi:preprotein translocase subunit SecF